MQISKYHCMPEFTFDGIGEGSPHRGIDAEIERRFDQLDLDDANVLRIVPQQVDARVYRTPRHRAERLSCGCNLNGIYLDARRLRVADREDVIERFLNDRMRVQSRDEDQRPFAVADDRIEIRLHQRPGIASCDRDEPDR